MVISTTPLLANRTGQRLVRGSLEGAILATAMVIAITGPLKSTTAQSAQEIAKQQSSEAADLPEGFRDMLLRTVDSTGKPVPQTRIYVAIWAGGPYQTSKREYTTNANGEAIVLVPDPPRLFRMWTQRDGYVPLFAQWWPDKQPDGHIVPEEFTFSLPSGTEIGGFITDDAGQPIEGATVEVMLATPVNERAARPVPSTWLAEVPGPGKNPCITDVKGRWTLDNVPAGDNIEVRVKLTHPEYISDKHWGQLQAEQSVSMDSLRNQTATIVMHQGTMLTGTLTDPEGNPVTDAVVVWGDDPYLQTGSQEVRTGARGVYRLPPLPTGTTSITVVAKGWMPEHRTVDIQPDGEPLNFKMRPGRRLRIRFVDSSGKAVPEVSVSITGWRDKQSLYNHRHPDVLDTGIPRTADQDGVYEWSWAPDDAVTYSFWKDGYQAIRSTSLTAGSNDHSIVLVRKLVVTGKVADASTGKPIESFRVTPAYGKPIPKLRVLDAITGLNGEYRFVFDDPSFFHYLLFEAEGYESVQSDVFAESDEEIQFDVQLNKSPER